jgi:hypothetical protein
MQHEAKIEHENEFNGSAGETSEKDYVCLMSGL